MVDEYKTQIKGQSRFFLKNYYFYYNYKKNYLFAILYDRHFRPELFQRITKFEFEKIHPEEIQNLKKEW